MGEPGLLRAAALLVPLGLALGLAALRRPSRQEWTGALLALGWLVPGLALLNGCAPRLDAWHFAATGGTLLGAPVEVVLGWAILWGPLALLAWPARSPCEVAAILGFIDLAVMARLEPLVTLGPRWLLLEAAALALLAVPAQLLARLTRDGRDLATRAALQALVFAGVFGGLVPAIVLEATGGSLGPLGLAAQLLALPVLLGFSAAQEFAVRGAGTPLPLDPPQRLVVSGLYAYLRNPMQVALVIYYLLLAAIAGSAWFLCGAAAALLYSEGFAHWDEERQLVARFGRDYLDWRGQVPAWIPRLRPHVARPARLYYAAGCGPCEELAGWIRRRGPRGLDFIPAQQHPTRDLTRLTYSPGDGSAEEEGVAALARALEHVHLGWALLGALLRMPGLRPAVQVLADVSGGGPRRVPRAPRGWRSTCVPGATRPAP